MVAQSKLWTTASCYELGHTWNPSCRHASLDLGKAAYSYSLRLYAIFYIVSKVIWNWIDIVSNYTVTMPPFVCFRETGTECTTWPNQTDA